MGASEEHRCMSGFDLRFNFTGQRDLFGSVDGG